MCPSHGSGSGILLLFNGVVLWFNGRASVLHAKGPKFNLHLPDQVVGDMKDHERVRQVTDLDRPMPCIRQLPVFP